jgi:hypothetical protein
MYLACIPHVSFISDTLGYMYLACGMRIHAGYMRDTCICNAARHATLGLSAHHGLLLRAPVTLRRNSALAPSAERPEGRDVVEMTVGRGPFLPFPMRASLPRCTSRVPRQGSLRGTYTLPSTFRTERTRRSRRYERDTSRYNQDTCRIHQDTSGYVSDRKLYPKTIGNRTRHPTHQRTLTRMTARGRPKPRPTQQPQPRSRPLSAAFSRLTPARPTQRGGPPPPANSTLPPPAVPERLPEPARRRSAK